MVGVRTFYISYNETHFYYKEVTNLKKRLRRKLNYYLLIGTMYAITVITIAGTVTVFVILNSIENG